MRRNSVSKKLQTIRNRIVRWRQDRRFRLGLKQYARPRNYAEELMVLQEQPLKALWSSRTTVSDNVALARLGLHSERLLEILSSLSGSNEDQPWIGAYRNLHQAVSITSIGVESDVFGHNFMCSTAARHDEAQSRVASHFISGKIVFLAVYNAIEIAGEVLIPPPKTATQFAIRHNLAKAGYRPFLGLKEALWDATRSSIGTIDFTNAAYIEAINSRSYVCVAAEHLRQFRNALLHGKLEPMFADGWSDETDDKICEHQTYIFQTQIRLALFFLQAILERCASDHSMAYPDDGLLLKDLIFGIQMNETEATSDQRDLFPRQAFPGWFA